MSYGSFDLEILRGNTLTQRIEILDGEAQPYNLPEVGWGAALRLDGASAVVPIDVDTSGASEGRLELILQASQTEALRCGEFIGGWELRLTEEIDGEEEPRVTTYLSGEVSVYRSVLS